jgi:hypothetical protein
VAAPAPEDDESDSEDLIEKLKRQVAEKEREELESEDDEEGLTDYQLQQQSDEEPESGGESEFDEE